MFKTLRVKLISALAGRNVSVAINCEVHGLLRIPSGMAVISRNVAISPA